MLLGVGEGEGVFINVSPTLDLGGGTFDVSLLEIEDGVFEVTWKQLCRGCFFGSDRYNNFTF